MILARRYSVFDQRDFFRRQLEKFINECANLAVKRVTSVGVRGLVAVSRPSRLQATTDCCATRGSKVAARVAASRRLRPRRTRRSMNVEHLKNEPNESWDSPMISLSPRTIHASSKVK